MMTGRSCDEAWLGLDNKKDVDAVKSVANEKNRVITHDLEKSDVMS